MKKLGWLALVLIIILASAVRFYKLDKFPPALTWDEAAVGYNAYTIWNWGKDEWGKSFPITFKSFGDDKNPVHVYATVPFVGLFGLNEFVTRAPSALFGVLNVIIIFFLARYLFKSNLVGLLAAFFLAISPYNIQFSRFNHELNFAIFFFLAGVVVFYKGLMGKKTWLLLAFFLFGVDLLTYQSAKVITPLLVLLLIALNIKKLLKIKVLFFWGVIIYTLFVCLLFIHPELLGGARLAQNPIPDQKEIIITRYMEYFKPQFLFISGDTNFRHSIQTVGTFYWLDLPFLVVGLLVLLWRLVIKRNGQMLFILVWIILAPLPGAVSSAVPHAPRAMFMTGSWTMVSALGAYTVIMAVKNKYVRGVIGSVVVLLGIMFFYKYIYEYFGNYTSRYAIEWRFGMKQAVEVSQSAGYKEVYITSAFMQPYIFFLYYLKTPLPEFLDTVYYNKTQSSSSSLVTAFGKYRFIWDEYHSAPDQGVLYILNPSIYNGLYQKLSFNTVKLIKYPNGTDALYAVTAKK